VHCWEGADSLYPNKWIFNDADECLAMVKDAENMDRQKLGERMREYVQLNYEARDKVDELIKELLQLHEGR
jgi:hypothetical protein